MFAVLLIAFLGTVGSGASAAHGALFFAVCLLLAALAAKRRAPVFAALLLVAIPADFFLVSRQLVWPQPSAMVQRENLPYVRKILDDQDKNREALERGGAQRLFVLDRINGVEHPPLDPATELNFTIAAVWNRLLFNTNAYWGIEAATGYFALQVDPFLLEKVPDPRWRRRIVNLMSVRYLLTLQPEGNSLNVNPEALPFASFARATEWLPSEEKILARIRDPRWNPAESVLLLGSGTSGAAAGGEVLRMDRRFDRIRIDARPRGEGIHWLLVNEHYQENWRATSGTGEAVPIVPANAWAMALRLPPAGPSGEVSLSLEYREPSYVWGLGAFVLWLGALGTAAWVARRARLQGSVRNT
jgi:hypothetical protein